MATRKPCLFRADIEKQAGTAMLCIRLRLSQRPQDQNEFEHVQAAVLVPIESRTQVLWTDVCVVLQFLLGDLVPRKRSILINIPKGKLFHI